MNMIEAIEASPLGQCKRPGWDEGHYIEKEGNLYRLVRKFYHQALKENLYEINDAKRCFPYDDFEPIEGEFEVSPDGLWAKATFPLTGFPPSPEAQWVPVGVTHSRSSVAIILFRRKEPVESQAEHWPKEREELKALMRLIWESAPDFGCATLERIANRIWELLGGNPNRWENSP
jgi:hypothetical protein